MTTGPVDWQQRADELAAQAVGDGKPTAWFEQLYAAGRNGSVTMPWDRAAPNPLLAQWADQRLLEAAGDRRAVVVGAGLGADAAFLAGLGYATTAFDVSPTAVAIAEERLAGPGLTFVTADLFALPPEWDQAFDLVVEIYTVQALPRSVRARATTSVGSLVAPGGTLVAIQVKLRAGQSPDDGPPWPLTRIDIQAFGYGPLTAVSIEAVPDADNPRVRRWLAEFSRP